MPCEIKPNGPIRRAIDAFLEKQRNVYRADPSRIERDAKSAEHATKDHVGRWFYEVFQNCDDACQNMESGKVEVRVTPAGTAKYLAAPEARYREVSGELKLPFPKLKHLEAEGL
jgi:hypothetical protein